MAKTRYLSLCFLILGCLVACQEPITLGYPYSSSDADIAVKVSDIKEEDTNEQLKINFIFDFESPVFSGAIDGEQMARLGSNPSIKDLEEAAKNFHNDLGKADSYTTDIAGLIKVKVELEIQKQQIIGVDSDWGPEPKCDPEMQTWIQKHGQTPIHIHFAITDLNTNKKLLKIHLYPNPDEPNCWGGFGSGGPKTLFPEIYICIPTSLCLKANDAFSMLWFLLAVEIYHAYIPTGNPVVDTLKFISLAIDYPSVAIAVLSIGGIVILGLYTAGYVAPIIISAIIESLGGIAVAESFVGIIMTLFGAVIVLPPINVEEPICISHWETQCCEKNLCWFNKCGEQEEIYDYCESDCQDGACTDCISQCNNKQCGDDGCGNPCGECDINYDCQNGKCIAIKYCGNELCDNGENCNNCVDDCGICEFCGDKKCNGNENCSSCSQDCGACPASCDNKKCEGDENYCNCPSDCQIKCGDGCCSSGESYCSCSFDCSKKCGDGCCSSGEDKCSCETDCGNHCGDGSCNCDETCFSCLQDCGSCAFCGDGVCNGSDTQSNCCKDCGCPSGKICQDNQCFCAPNCVDKECGDNGCGGNCGSCAIGYVCQNGKCIGNCQCGSWQPGGESGNSCGVNGCKCDEQYQIRFCNPIGCNSEEQCILSANCAQDCIPNSGIIELHPNGWCDFEDSFVASENEWLPLTNDYVTSLRIGMIDLGGKLSKTRTYIDFSFCNQVPADIIIQEAILVFSGPASEPCVWNDWFCPDGPLDITLEFYRVTSQWDELGIKWSEQPSSVPAGILKTIDLSANGCKNDIEEFDITSLVQYWHSNPSENYGLMIKAKEEDTYNDVCYSGIGYNSSEGSGGGWPYLKIVYTK